MNWIFYSITYIAKSLAICGLILLFAVAIPLIGCIFALGMFLGYLRDTESQSLAKIQLKFPFSIKFEHFNLTSEAISRIQNVRIRRH